MPSKTLNVRTFEQALVDKQREITRTFNRVYAGTTQVGDSVVKARILQSEIEIYTGIIDALRASME